MTFYVSADDGYSSVSGSYSEIYEAKRTGGPLAPRLIGLLRASDCILAFEQRLV